MIVYRIEDITLDRPVHLDLTRPIRRQKLALRALTPGQYVRQWHIPVSQGLVPHSLSTTNTKQHGPYYVTDARELLIRFKR